MSARPVSERPCGRFSHQGEEYFHRLEGHVVCELYLKLDRPEARASSPWAEERP